MSKEELWAWVGGGAVVGVGIGFFLARQTGPKPHEKVSDAVAEAEPVRGDWETGNPNERVPFDNVGPALYTHAKTLIAGGVGLLSKRPELFLPDL